MGTPARHSSTCNTIGTGLGKSGQGLRGGLIYISRGDKAPVCSPNSSKRRSSMKTPLSFAAIMFLTMTNVALAASEKEEMIDKEKAVWQSVYSYNGTETVDQGYFARQVGFEILLLQRRENCLP